jgi:hypothetical protein
MPQAYLFWALMLIWLLFGAAPLFRTGERNWTVFGGTLLPFLALALLGWQVFGPAVKG